MPPRGLHSGYLHYRRVAVVVMIDDRGRRVPGSGLIVRKPTPMQRGIMPTNSQDPWALPDYTNDDEGTWPFGPPPKPTDDDVQRLASDELRQLVDKLEPTLDVWQRRLLHRIRLSAEALGSIRAASRVRKRR
jgi:hypothetical protein